MIDKYDDLLSQIAAAKGRDLPALVCSKLNELFDTMGYNTARSIVRQLTLMDSIPNNIIGYIERYWIDIKNEQDKRLEQKEGWEAKENCIDTDEAHWLAEVLNEVNVWHEIGLSKKNQFGCTTPMSIEEYIKNGMPQSWSPIIDHFLQGAAKPYKIEIGGDKGALAKYFKQYYETLFESRKNRTKKIC